jgi:hypothetical protein
LATEPTEIDTKKTNNVIYGNCWLAYFDILGFKKEVEFADTEKYKNGEHRKEYILGVCDNCSEEIKLLKKFEEFEKGLVKVIWFSDTFIFYTPNDSKECLKAIENISGFFFRTHFTGNHHSVKKPAPGTPISIYIPLRGCLNYGRFYADPDNDIYWGTALNKAHELAEGQNWIGYVLSSEAINQIQKYHTDYWEIVKDGYKKYNVPMKNNKYESLYAYANKKFHPDPGTILGESLVWMWMNFLGKNEKYEENIIVKYENTKNFLLGIYPDIYDLVKDVGKINSL